MTNKTKLLLLTLVAAAAARADFSYTTTAKGSGPAQAANQETKTYLKGNKMMIDSGSTATIMDFGAQTFTQINKTAKTYTVKKFADLVSAAGAGKTEVNVDVKQTGQTKTINGFNATQTIMTMAVDNPQMAQSGMKMQMEMEIWSSTDVPGAADLAAFYKQNGDKFPWAAMGGGGNPGMAQSIAQIQKAMSGLKGVPVLQIIRAKNANAPAGGGAAQDPRLAQARAQLEAMAKQGGPQGQAAQQALARMGGAAAGGSGVMFETTRESGNFSTASIPDSVFAIPAGFEQR